MQRQEIPEEEEPLQGKMSETVQRQEVPEEEEPLQGKMIGTIQRQEIPEEEEPMQGKFESKPEISCPSCFAAPIVQRQELEEEEKLLQGKMIETVQRQEIPEEEEPLQSKMARTVQRQEIPEEEEPLQGKMIETIQQQEIPEEEEPLQGKMIQTTQRQEIPEEEEPLQTKRENNTGMPDNLKTGVESLSGINMSDVRVNYNSSKPAEVGALAYTQGTEIHVASGQEKHLPHEAWHVVQQKQGRVQLTTQVKGLGINDDPSLEHEADMMGTKTAQFVPSPDEEMLQGKFGEGVAEKAEKAPNNKGLPDNLKAGIENLSGMSMDGVNVHYNSGKPASDLPRESHMRSYSPAHTERALQGQTVPRMTQRPSTAGAMTTDSDGEPLVQCRMQALVDRSPRLTQQQGTLKRAHAAPRMMVPRQCLQDLGSTARGSIVQREPEATPVEPSDRFIYHITTLENFHSIVAQRGLMPLNWIIEGTHGQESDLGATARGLDAVRGESAHESPEAHARLVQQAREAWKQNRGKPLEADAARLFADIKLGRKRDFVYGTRQSSTLANYQRHYVLDSHLEPESLVVLRWRQHDEAYYCDLQDTDAIKALEQVDLSRLEVARGRGVGDTNAAAQAYLATLPWQRADDLEGLTKAGLLPSRPVVVANDEGAPPADHGEAEEEDLDVLMARLEAELSAEDAEGNDELARLEAEIALEDAEEDAQIEALEDAIAREDEEEDSLIAELESELGPEVVEAIERQVAEELLADQQETDRVVAMALDAMRQAAPLLLEAEDLEEQLRIATQEADEQISLQEATSERLANPLQMSSPTHGSDVIQCMQEGAGVAMEVLLEDQLGVKDFESVANDLDQRKDLENVTAAQIMELAQRVNKDSNLKIQLAQRLQQGKDAFAAALLGQIALFGQIAPEQKPEQDEPPVTVDFENLIRTAVDQHAPLLGAQIDEAQERARKSGKKLLVIVGEKHDDIYARVMVTVLVGAMQRISIQRLYLETTPETLHKYVEPYHDSEPDPNLSEEGKARAHFFRSLYKLGTTLEGVDVQKETAKREVEQRQGKKPTTEPSRSEWEAKFLEQTVAARNTGMANALATRSESGVLLVGLNHLPGLASDPVIQNAYEIVTVAASLPSEGIDRDKLLFGRTLSHTQDLNSMPDLYVGSSNVAIGGVDPVKAFALAQRMAFELSTATL